MPDYTFHAEKNRLLTDAASRLTITLINRANSSLIAQLGDLSHDALHGGFIVGAGQTAVSDDAMVISTNPSTGTNLPMVQAYQPTCHQWLTPSKIREILMYLTRQHDLVYLAKSLGLDKKDFDHIRGRLVRSYVDNIVQVPSDCTPLPIFDHLDTFIRMDVIFMGDIFTLKHFKYTDAPGEYPFLFLPEHPGIYFPEQINAGTPIILDTNISEVLSHTHANAWLNDAGDISELDWEIFTGKGVYYIWHDNDFQGKNHFASAVKFVSEARRHGVSVKVIRRKDSTWNSKTLEDRDVIKAAAKFGLDIPDNLLEKSHILSFKENVDFVPKDFRFLWPSGGCSWFGGPGCFALFKILLGYTCAKFSASQVTIMLPDTAAARTAKIYRETGEKITCISMGILEENGALEKILRQQDIKILFVIFADEVKGKEFVSVLDLCERLEIVTGVFSPEEEVPNKAVSELVAQHYITVDADSNVIAKNMTTKTIEKYSFTGFGEITVNPSSEAEMSKYMEDSK